jgi:hypothetical protein
MELTPDLPILFRPIRAGRSLSRAGRSFIVHRGREQVAAAFGSTGGAPAKTAVPRLADATGEIAGPE